MNQQRRAELRTAVLLIRYRSTQPTSPIRKFQTYKAIAANLNLTVHEVQHICRKALLPKKVCTADQSVRLLEQEHLDFLLAPRTLEQWAGLTMK